MTVGLAIAGLVGLIAIAIGAEAWLRRGKKRPLSSVAPTQRRWDDPAYGNTRDDRLIDSPVWSNSSTGIQESKTYAVSKNPHHQTKSLMPRTEKDTQK